MRIWDVPFARPTRDIDFLGHVPGSAEDVAGIVGMGFGLRALARRLVRSTPGIGWVLKAVTGYTATLAIGLGAVQYFEKGAPASTSRVLALASSLKR